jgi:hypothetical protein
LRQAHDESASDRIGDHDEHDRNGAALLLKGRHHGGRVSDNELWAQAHKLLCQGAHPIGIALGETLLDRDVVSCHPAELAQRFHESGQERLKLRIGSGAAVQETDAPPAPVC